MIEQIFNLSSLIFLIACTGAIAFYIFYVKINLSGTSVLFGMLILLYGPALYFFLEHYALEKMLRSVHLASIYDVSIVSHLEIAMTLAFLFLCLGIYLCDRILKNSNRDFSMAISGWKNEPVEKSQARILWLGIAVLAVLIVFTIIGNHFDKFIEYFFSGLSYREKIALRQNNTDPGYIYRLLMANALPAAAVMLVAGSWLQKQPYPIFYILTACVALAVLLGKAAMFSKAPPVIFALQLCVALFLVRSLYISKYKLIALGTIATILAAVMTIIALPQLDSATSVLRFLSYRVFMVPNEALLEYFAAIPQIIDHSWGGQFSWLFRFQSDAPLKPTYILVAEALRGVPGSTSPAMFIADAWADFSWYGIIIASLVCGAIFRLADYFLIIRLGRSVAAVTGLSIMHFAAFTAVSTSLQTAMLTGGMYLIPFLLLYFKDRLKT